MSGKCDDVYQELFLMPGMWPSFASSRKQMRHKSKSRMYPCARPQRKQRFTARVLNFGFLLLRAMTLFFAMGQK